MADTVRTPQALIALLSDGAAAHSTNRQMLRDLLVSIPSQMGLILPTEPRFGADPSGVSDSTAALNAAFAVPNASVYVPPGSYKVTSNLANPACGAIIGAGRLAGGTRFVCGAAVTQFLGLYAVPQGPAIVRDFWVDGTLTTNAVGIKCGDTVGFNVWTGTISDVRCSGFTGANGVGIWYADSLKAVLEYVQCTQNTTGMLIQRVGAGLPTTTTLRRLDCSGNSGVGCKVLSGEMIVFDGFTGESNGLEALLLDASSGSTINAILTGGSWIEANYGGDPSKYSIKALAPVGTGTCRLSMGRTFFNGLGGLAKSILLDGSGVTYDLDRVHWINEAATVKIQNGASGIIDRAPHLPETTISDTTGFRAGVTAGQLVFPATQSASTDPNTLDDYEEGTFTPAFSLGVGSVTYTTQTGTFTKIGRLVTVQINIVVNTVSTPSGTFRITGLPFTSSATAKGAVSIIAFGFGATVANLVGTVDPSATTIRLFKFAAGTVASPAAGDILAACSIQVTASYEV